MIFSGRVGPHWKALYLEWHSWMQMSRECQLPDWMQQEMVVEMGVGVVGHYDGNVCWYQLRTHLGRLDKGSVVYNTTLMGASSQEQGTAGQVTGEHWGTADQGSVVYNTALMGASSQERGLHRPDNGQSSGGQWTRGQLSIILL